MYRANINEKVNLNQLYYLVLSVVLNVMEGACVPESLWTLHAFA